MFCERVVIQERYLLLGAALGFSAGVMVYVSFVEIFTKSVLAFDACNSLEVPCLWEDEKGSAGYVAATICLFAGVVVTLLLDVCVVHLSNMGGSHSHGPEHFHGVEDVNEIRSSDTAESSLAAVNPEAITDGAATTNATSETPTATAVEKLEPKALEEQVKKEKLHHMGISKCFPCLSATIPFLNVYTSDCACYWVTQFS